MLCEAYSDILRTKLVFEYKLANMCFEYTGGQAKHKSTIIEIYNSYVFIHSFIPDSSIAPL